MTKNKKYIKTILVVLILSGIIIPARYSQSQGFKGNEYIIGPGDVLSIQVWDHEDLNRVVDVSQEMAFSFPLIGKVYAEGLSVFTLSNLIKDKLSKKYIINPQVTVNIQEYKSQKVFLFGWSKKPGSYTLKGKTYLLDLISEIDEFDEISGKSITILRPKTPKITEKQIPSEPAAETEYEIIRVNLDRITAGDSRSNILIAPGDSICVNKADRIFIIGEVKNPGQYLWENNLTVLESICLAGGASPRGAPDRVSIVRTQDGTENIVKPRMEDLVSPDDIIKIPKSYF